MASRPALTHALATLIATVLAGGVAVVLTDEGSSLRPFPDPVSIETTVEEVEVLPPGQAEVTGLAVSVRATGVLRAPLPLPVRLEPGPGAAMTIRGAVVDGERTTIVWDGGRPLRLTGDGGVDLGPTEVAVAADGTSTWPLDGAVRGLVPGRYELDAPVAVGRDGLAEPRRGATFEADEATTITTRGAPPVVEPPAPRQLDGPGSLELEGTFAVRTAAGTRPATRLAFGPGPFTLALQPGGGGVAVTATVNGRLDLA